MATQFPTKMHGMKLYLVTVTILPQKEGTDLTGLIIKLANSLVDYSTVTRTLYRFKVSGESKLLSVIQVHNITGLERRIAGMWTLGAVQIDCHPIISYESFARSIKVDDPLIQPLPCSLAKEGLYWLDFDVEYTGKSTDELISIWKREAEAVLQARAKDGTSIELYKYVAERKVCAFINAADPEQLDLLSFTLPIMKENGNNVKIKCRAIQFLDDYTQRINSESV